MKNMDSEKARQVLAQHMSYPPTTPETAGSMLHNYENGYIQLPTGFEAQVFMALQVLRDEKMGKQHANDVKRQQRSQGRNMRKVRTGSRR